MFKLDFVICGPQRTSTTFIHTVLKQVPNINLPNVVKETNFFNNKFHKGFGYYESLFQNLKPSNLVGEVCPSYFSSEIAIKNIRNNFPHAKIIVIYRNPIERSWSMFNHHLKKGRIKPNLQSAIEKIPDIIESSRFSLYLDKWNLNNNLNPVNLLHYKELCQDPKKFFNKLQMILCLNKPITVVDQMQRINASTLPKYPILAKILAKGAAFLREHDLHLFNEIGKKMMLTKFYGGKKPNNISQAEIKILKNYFSQRDFINYEG